MALAGARSYQERLLRPMKFIGMNRATVQAMIPPKNVRKRHASGTWNARPKQKMPKTKSAMATTAMTMLDKLGSSEASNSL